MKTKNTQKVSKKEFLELLNRVENCEASKASAEIMLERFSNGREIDFPFLYK